jgi:hypothetical protein
MLQENPNQSHAFPITNTQTGNKWIEFDQIQFPESWCFRSVPDARPGGETNRCEASKRTTRKRGERFPSSELNKKSFSAEMKEKDLPVTNVSSSPRERCVSNQSETGFSVIKETGAR